MELQHEILRAINHVNALVKTNDKKGDDEIKAMVQATIIAVNNDTIDFSDASLIVLKQGNKKRVAKRYIDPFSKENIICHSIKQMLDREFKVKYPNRNKISSSLFNTISTVKSMSDFTIIKFDFKDYFNSTSSIYVYEKYLKKKLRNRAEVDLLNKFVKATKYAYAGLQTSNVISEIIGKHFDREILKVFSSFGLIFYERYIDDGIIILNEFLNNDNCFKLIETAINSVFYDQTIKAPVPCKTKLNMDKYIYVSKRGMHSNVDYILDFLGYEFYLKKSNGPKDSVVEVKYGITQSKRDKYCNRITKIVSLYNPTSSSTNDLEILRHRIITFTKRTVYLTKKYRSNIWRVKGFISNYGELRHLLESGHIHVDTEAFLKNAVYDAFTNLGVPIPYFLTGNGKEIHSLYYNLNHNKTIILNPQIGSSLIALSRLCEKIGIPLVDSNGVQRGYGTLVRDYLIKTKVGY